MPPDTLLTVVEQQGGWLHVRLRNGSEGWAASRYIACCRNVD
ncbi:SH3 domain-containing protein [Bradyrhizobium sp.]